MANQIESDTPLIMCFSPNALVVGRGGTNQPLYSQIVPRLEENIINRRMRPSIAGDEETTRSNLQTTQPMSMHNPSSLSISNVNSQYPNSQNRSPWHWPSHILQMACDELIIVVFPTEWSRELRVGLARLVFEDLKAASAVFVCSAVAVGYSVGLGLERDDAHFALYSHLPFGKHKATKLRRTPPPSSSNSSSSGSNSEDTSTTNSDSDSSSDEGRENNKKLKLKKAPTTSQKRQSKDVARAQHDDNDNAAVAQPNSGTTLGRPSVGSSSFATPRSSTKFCVVELHYDRLTCSLVECGAVSRFVSVRLPAAALDSNGALLELRSSAIHRAGSLEGAENLLAPISNNRTRAQLIGQRVQQALFSAHGGCVPSTLGKLEKKIAADINQDEGHFSGDHLQIDFQVAFALAGEAAAIAGVRDALSEVMQCDSASPFDPKCYRVLLPSACPSPPIQTDHNNNYNKAPPTQPLASSSGSLFSRQTGDTPSLPVSDLQSYFGASLLSTVPDKALAKATVTKDMYLQKGPEVILIRAAM